MNLQCLLTLYQYFSSISSQSTLVKKYSLSESWNWVSYPPGIIFQIYNFLNSLVKQSAILFTESGTTISNSQQEFIYPMDVAGTSSYLSISHQYFRKI